MSRLQTAWSTLKLNKIFKLLVEDQSKAKSPHGMSPSHHNVLDILVTLCQVDSPLVSDLV